MLILVILYRFLLKVAAAFHRSGEKIHHPYNNGAIFHRKKQRKIQKSQHKTPSVHFFNISLPCNSAILPTVTRKLSENLAQPLLYMVALKEM